jgi:hypothetical protein
LVKASKEEREVSDYLVATIVFACVFGGSLLGMLLAWVLPHRHLSSESRDVIRIVMAMLATLSAVVLGLLTGSAITSLAEKESELRRAGVKFIMLDRALAAYGPAAVDTRALLKKLLAERIGQMWPEESDGTVALTALGSGPGVDLVRQDLFKMSPTTDEQRWLHAHALELTDAIATSRWTTVQQIESRFPWGFFIVVVFWLSIIFASFGLFAPRNASVTAALFVAALALSGAIFMILEMEQPYSGVVKIPSTGLRIALDQLGR